MHVMNETLTKLSVCLSLFQLLARDTHSFQEGNSQGDRDRQWIVRGSGQLEQDPCQHWSRGPDLVGRRDLCFVARNRGRIAVDSDSAGPDVGVKLARLGGSGIVVESDHWSIRRTHLSHPHTHTYTLYRYM